MELDSRNTHYGIFSALRAGAQRSAKPQYPCFPISISVAGKAATSKGGRP
jgi:hypothetical protein